MNSDDLAALKDMLTDRRMKELEEMLKSSINSKHWSSGIVNVTTMMLLLIGLISSFITAYINLDKSISLLEKEQSRTIDDIVILRRECKERARGVTNIEKRVTNLEYKTGVID